MANHILLILQYDFHKQQKILTYVYCVIYMHIFPYWVAVMKLLDLENKSVFIGLMVLGCQYSMEWF